MSPEPLGKEDKEDEEGAVSSAHGDGDISTPSAKLLTTSLPQSTGEQTNPSAAKCTQQLASDSHFEHEFALTRC